MENPRNRWHHRISQKLISARIVTWLLSHSAHIIDRYTMRLTNGRFSAAALFTGLPVICLTTIGARSGRPHTIPLLGIPDGQNLIIIASNWGQGHHPAWYYNIRANPDVQVKKDGRTYAYIAHEAAGEERQRCWQTAVQCYPGYEAYKKWTDGREIPVIVLAPLQ
jgi:deazaflavin-dependent oxidoreductase (nitroreductase family)